MRSSAHSPRPFTEAVADVNEKDKMLIVQWQDGKKVIVWPEELAPVKARFPTPPWSQR